MRFSLTIDGDTDFVAKLVHAPSVVDKLVALKMEGIGKFLVSYVRTDKLSGQNLNMGTGKLAASITSNVEHENGRSVLTVGPEGVPYAAIQERGGQTAAHVITASRADMLHFYWHGREVFFKSVNHPGSNIKATHYMKETLEDNSGYIRTMIAEAVNEAIGKL